MSNLEDDSPSFLAKRRPVVPSTSGNADTEADRGASDSVTIVPGPRALQNPPNSSAPVYEDRRDTDMDADDFEILDASNLAAQGLDVDGLLRLVDENPATEEMDETELRQAISRLVKAADTNSKMRAMHEDDPMKFLPSEIELDESLKALGGLVTESVLYDLFIELGGPTLLVGQLHHANLDIGISALTFGCSLIDEGGLSTVDDARMNERAAGWAMVSALTASSFFSEAVTFLLRLDESIPEHAEAAAGVLRCFSSIIAAHGEMAAEMSKTGIVQWLLMRIRYDEVHPYYVNPSTDGEASPASQSPPTFLYPDRCSIPVPRAYQFGLRLFPALRLLAAELLSELLAAPGSLIRAVFLSCGGMKDILDVLRTYRSQPPKGHADDGLTFSMCSPDETEFAESLFLALATVLSPIDAASAFTSACALCCQEVAREGSTGAEADVLAGKRSDCVGQFIAHSGVELMMEMLRRRVCWGFSALRVMTAAAQGAVAAGQQSLPTLDPPMYSAEAAQEAEKSAGESPTALAQAFIEAEALRGLFPVFMSPRCSKWDADEKTIMGHVITMINFLFTHLHSINFLRVVRKFTEENYTKTARACSFFARMKVRTKHQRKALESGPLVRPTMAMLLAQGVEPDEAISELDAALVSHEAEIMLELMGKGTLPLLQKAALLLGLLVSAGEPLISVKIKNFLLGEGMSLTDIVDVLSAQVMAMSSDTPASTQVEDPGRLSELTIIRNVTAAVNAEIEQALRESRRDPLAGVPGVDDAPVQPPSRPSSAGALGAGSSRNR